MFTVSVGRFTERAHAELDVLLSNVSDQSGVMYREPASCVVSSTAETSRGAESNAQVESLGYARLQIERLCHRRHAAKALQLVAECSMI